MPTASNRAVALKRLALVICATVLVATASFQAFAQPQSILVKADTASLCALIGKNQVISLRYIYDPATAESREIEPYAVGFTRKRDTLLFGRQIKGYSKSAESGAGELPGWRNFRVDKIKAKVVTALSLTFEPLRPSLGDYRYISEFACKSDSAFGG
jgi:hypothetical protein